MSAAALPPLAAGTVYVWRHPRARGAEGRCVGRTDLPVDRRKAKRLAHRIRAFARRHNLPRAVTTSPLRRCADVGRVLARWGWRHEIEPLLIELDFGSWDGQRWCDIERAEIERWCAELASWGPGGGESAERLLARVQAWQPRRAALAIGHGGWLSAARWLATHGAGKVGQPFDPGGWPAAPRHGSVSAFRPYTSARSGVQAAMPAEMVQPNPRT